MNQIYRANLPTEELIYLLNQKVISLDDLTDTEFDAVMNHYIESIGVDGVASAIGLATRKGACGNCSSKETCNTAQP